MSPDPDVVRHPERRIVLDAVHNFRDLGGYPTADGRVTRWRTLFRADGLQRLTTGDLAEVRRLGIRTVIDLRTDDEVAERGRFPVGGHAVTLHHVSILDATWSPHAVEAASDDPVDFLVAAYRSMLAEGGERFGHALGLLAQPAAWPAVFHCAAGKDRTGLLAALLLAGLGVPDDVVVADYALSQEARERAWAWVQSLGGEALARYEQVPAAFHAAHPDAMQSILDDVRARWGSVRGYTAGVGMPSVAWARLEAGFLEPAG